MRGIIVFVIGVLVGLLFEINSVEDTAQGVMELNHVGISVEDVGVSLAFYSETMGFEKVFSRTNKDGQMVVALVKIGESTFLELSRSSSARPVGITHIGIQVEGMESVLKMYHGLGARPLAPRIGIKGEVMSYIVDPQGVPIELAEYPSNWLTDIAQVSE